ncbi:hypothetical protein TNCT_585091 [Trichonephila clavata]|uniref:Uncharacterized protein n=1 Tax=Trichonephila clavata TaxID=2740835 RepID=A0A8X6GLH1_TRICU|nr:hypothetical protein TNCT_585091 [Trichonephila clavata]
MSVCGDPELASGDPELPSVDATLNPPATAPQLEARNRTCESFSLTVPHALLIIVAILGAIFIGLFYALKHIALLVIGFILIACFFTYCCYLWLCNQCCNNSNPLAELPRAQQRMRSESLQLSPQERVPMLSGQDRTQYPGVHETSVALLNAQRRRQSTTSITRF